MVPPALSEHEPRTNDKGNVMLINQSAAGVARYFRLSYKDEATVEAVAAALSPRLNSAVKPTDGAVSLDVIDIGAGGGWVTLCTLEAMTKLLPAGSTIQLTAIEADFEMRAEFKRQAEAIGLSPKSMSEAHSWSGTFCGSTLEVSLFGCTFEDWLDKYRPDQRKFDLIFSLYTIHHLDNWREGTNKHAQLLKPTGRIVIAELLGDHALWSKRFDQGIEAWDLLNDKHRQAYHRFARAYIKADHEHRRAIKVGVVSASGSDGIVERFREQWEIVPDGEPVGEVIHHNHVSTEDWFEILGLGKDTPSYSIAQSVGQPVLSPTEAEDVKKAIKAAMETVLQGVEPQSKSKLVLTILKHSEPGCHPKFLEPGRATANYLRRAATLIPPVAAKLSRSNSDDLKAQLRTDIIGPDMKVLATSGVLAGFDLAFAVRHSLLANQWITDTVCFCRSIDMLAAYGLYSLVLNALRDHEGTETTRLTELLYRDLPRKAIVQSRHDFEASSPFTIDFQFDSDGDGVERLNFNMPAKEKVLSKGALAEWARLLEIAKCAAKHWVDSTENTRTNNLDSAGGGYLVGVQSFEKVFKQRMVAVEPNLDGKLKLKFEDCLNADFSKEACEKIKHLFGSLDDASGGDKIWKNKRLIAAATHTLPTALGLASLLGVPCVSHLPSRDNLKDILPNDLTVRTLVETSSGGLILYHNRDRDQPQQVDNCDVARIVIDDGDRERAIMVLRDFINLRNRALSTAEHITQARGEIQTQANRAAAAAIMSRNMSHNLGSHPLSKMVQAETSGKSMGQLTELLNERAVFAGYLRDRMEFIANVATDGPTRATAEPLKDLVKKFQSQTFLNRHLVELDKSCEVQTCSSLDVLHALLPNTIMGQQAFFTIIENILRNSEKHGNHKADRCRLCITVECAPTAAQDYIDVTFVDFGSSGAPAVLEQLNKDLADPFFQMNDGLNNGVLSRTAWGLKEMRIAAAYLRLRPATAADGGTDVYGTSGFANTKDVPWVQAVEVRDGASSCLGWRIRLLRPRTALIDVNVLPAKAQKLRAQLHEAGHSVLEKSQQGIEKSAVLHPQRFLVVSPEQAATMAIDPLRLKMPSRWIVVCDAPSALQVPVSVVFGTLTTKAWLKALTAPESIEGLLYQAWTDALASKAGHKNRADIPLLLAAFKKNELDDLDTSAFGAMPDPIGARIAKKTGALFAHEDVPFDLTKKQHEELGQRHPLLYWRIHTDADPRENDLTGLRNCVKCSGGTCTAHNNNVLTRAHVRAFNVLKSNSAQLALGKAALSNPVAAETLREAGLVWVIMIDERLGEDLNKAERLQLRRRLAWSGTFVPFISRLPDNEFDVQPDSLVTSIKELRQLPHALPCQIFVSIHLGLFQKHTSPRAYLDTLKTALSNAYNVPVEIVVHSGRGRPKELSPQLTGAASLVGYRFIEYASLDHVLRTEQDKLALVELMYSARA
jgi:SAM-dependent methyltransferase